MLSKISSALIHILFYIVNYLGGLLYIFLYEFSALLINVYQMIFMGKGYLQMDDFVDLRLPNVKLRFFLGIISIITIYIFSKYLAKTRTKRNRKRKYQLKMLRKKRALSQTGPHFTSKQRKKYDQYLAAMKHDESVNMSPLDFEYFVAYLFFRSGYSPVLMTDKSGDFGLDVIATYKKINYGIQCKYYRQSKAVGVAAVQAAIAGTSAYGLDRAIVVTTSTFTESAKKLAQATNTVLVEHDTFNAWQKDTNKIFRVVNDKQDSKISRYLKDRFTQFYKIYEQKVNKK